MNILVDDSDEGIAGCCTWRIKRSADLFCRSAALFSTRNEKTRTTKAAVRATCLVDDFDRGIARLLHVAEIRENRSSGWRTINHDGSVKGSR